MRKLLLMGGILLCSILTSYSQELVTSEKGIFVKFDQPLTSTNLVQYIKINDIEAPKPTDANGNYTIVATATIHKESNSSDGRVKATYQTSSEVKVSKAERDSYMTSNNIVIDNTNYSTIIQQVVQVIAIQKIQTLYSSIEIVQQTAP